MPMWMTMFRRSSFYALTLAAIVLLQPASAAHAGLEPALSFLGSWTMRVTPLPPPGVAVEPPPPFTAFVNFEAGLTVHEVDGANHANAKRMLLPDLGPVGVSNGIGAWAPSGWTHARCKLINLLFSSEGTHIGYFVTHLTLTLTSSNAFEAEGQSGIVLGEDPEGEVIFTGPLALHGSRVELDPSRP